MNGKRQYAAKQFRAYALWLRRKQESLRAAGLRDQAEALSVAIRAAERQIAALQVPPWWVRLWWWAANRKRM